jgi:uncharacterized protein with PhoU and TrkA domain
MKVRVRFINGEERIVTEFRELYDLLYFDLAIERLELNGEEIEVMELMPKLDCLLYDIKNKGVLA